MFLLFFGYGAKVRRVGAAGERTCPHCRNTARWEQLERYRYLSLFFVRIARWRRERLVACPVCAYAELQPATRSRRFAPVPV
jgi:hypothetical protein